MMLSDVGVVIIGRNEGERLSNCIDAVKMVNRNIVYVNSGSTDGSLEFARRSGITVVYLDPSRIFTAARARNEGFDALKAISPQLRWVQFIDGDCVLVPDWLQKATTFIADRPEIAVVCGRRRERFPEASIYNRFIDMEWDTPTGEARACGGDAMMRVEAFEAVGGFSSFIVAGEEPDLCFRMREKRWKIWRLEEEMTLHDAAMANFRQWWNRAVRSGYGCAQLWRLYRNSGPPGLTRALLRALIWSGLTLAIIAGALLAGPKALILFLAYPLEVCRIAFRRRTTSSESWAYQFIMTISKFAETQGIMKYICQLIIGASPTPIEYKRSRPGLRRSRYESEQNR